jgi:hypothetical protein
MYIALFIMILVMLLGGPLRRFCEQFMHRIKPEEHGPPPGTYKEENQPMLKVIDVTADTAANGVQSLSPRGAFWIGVILFPLIFLIPFIGVLLFVGYCGLMIYLNATKAGPWKPQQ